MYIRLKPLIMWPDRDALEGGREREERREGVREEERKWREKRREG